ncbi:hypothetical protein [Streptomyces sp. NPDC054865]
MPTPSRHRLPYLRAGVPPLHELRVGQVDVLRVLEPRRLENTRMSEGLCATPIAAPA